jgi:lipoprotein-releasing system ATP-binding protein
LLQVANLSKDYPTSRGALRVLSDVSFELNPGDAAAVTGPSGSGKSSLLYILGGLEPPTSGTVTLDGDNPLQLDANALAAFRNQRIGFVLQDHCLLPQCSVLENVLVPTLVRGPKPEARSTQREPRGAADTQGDDGRARDLIARVGLADRIDHRPAELSGGERQRVAIARALIRKPRLLLCDEPTGNLDQASAENVAGVLLDLHRTADTMLVVVTHSAELAQKCTIRFELHDTKLIRAR